MDIGAWAIGDESVNRDKAGTYLVADSMEVRFWVSLNETRGTASLTVLTLLSFSLGGGRGRCAAR